MHQIGEIAKHAQRSAFYVRNSQARKSRLRAGAAAMVFVAIAPSLAFSQETAPICDDGVSSCTAGDRVIYLPAFFAQYNPVTALDMVQRVPGFSIDSGDNVRGFSGAAGNVLIDGQRPSTKSSDITDILSRIGAGNVARIELIRGGTGGLDVGGQSVVVNVVRTADQAGGNPSPWSFSLLQRRPNGGLRPQGEISYSGKSGALSYVLGADFFGASLTYGGEEQITRYFGDDETRLRAGEVRELGGGANVSLERGLENGDIARLNVEGSIYKSREQTTETRFPAIGGPNVAVFPYPYKEHSYEVGGDYEHGFTDHFDIKLIALYKRSFENYDSGFIYMPAAGAADQSLFVSDQDIGETIGRVEFDWSGWSKHTIQFGGEVAHNFIDSTAEFFVDDGFGALTPQEINGANTRVAELRGEPFAKDSWSVSDKLNIDIGMAVELSSISQSGDSENARFFVYPKPSLTFTYNATPKTQFRLSGKREVNQLSFDEFVSSVNFDDEDFDFGNPELQPQRSWVFDLAFEQRFGEIGVIGVSSFYKLVNDVEDLLPIGGIVEVPGNIGDGAIWGGTLDLTVPLDPIGLKHARFESSITARKSSVRDPVTGFDRRFSNLETYQYELEFRQDFPKKKISWGWSMNSSGAETSYGLDEITTFTYQPDITIFVETTAIKGVKVRLQANDIINVNVQRDRTVYAGSRALDIPAFREVRGNKNGGGITLTLSGTF